MTLWGTAFYVSLPFAVFASVSAWAGAFSRTIDVRGPHQEPSIRSLVKPEVYKRMREREIMTHATLDDVDRKGAPEGLKRYSFYTLMFVHASPRLTHKILTDYRLYAKMIPYIDRANYVAADKTLELEGGIWRYRLHSWVKFDERGEGWVHYTIVAGHFTGLSGEILFEPLDDGTAVLMNGSQESMEWPPKFVIEKGAEIVFEFTARRMRSYLESEKATEQVASPLPSPVRSGGPTPHEFHDKTPVPQPRNHL